MWTSWDGNAGNFGGLNLFCLSTNKFGVLAEETIGEIPHRDQHGTTKASTTTSETIEIENRCSRTQSVMQPTLRSRRPTPNDRIRTGCTSSKLKVMSTSKDKGGTIRTDDEQRPEE